MDVHVEVFHGLVSLLSLRSEENKEGNTLKVYHPDIIQGDSFVFTRV